MSTAILKVYCAISIPIIIAGCVREVAPQPQDENLHEVVFHAGWDPETKTVLQEDGSVWWSPGDEISLFINNGYAADGGYKLTSTNDKPSAVTDFVGQVGNKPANESYIAIYPYNEANHVNGAAVSTVIPSVQTAKEDTFEKDMFVSIAISGDENLFFTNICSGVKFSVKTNGIHKIVISGVSGQGAGLAGGIYNPDVASDIYDFGGSGATVTIVAPSDSGFEPGKYYYAVLLAATCDVGIDVSYYKGDEVATFRYEEPVEFKRGVFKRLIDKDEGLNYRKAYSTFAKLDYYNILPAGVDKRTITEAYFHSSSDKQTETTVGWNSDIYFELIGTVAHYYTLSEAYSVEGYRLFYGWNSLRKLDISSFDTFDSQSFKEMFSGCMSLESIDLSNFATDNSTDMSGMFASCASLQSLDLSNFHTEKVTTMNGMFGCSWDGRDGYSNYHYCVSKGCSSLKTLDLSSFNTSNLEDAGGMFADCINLEEVDISTWETPKLTNASSMFAGCIKLKEVDLSSLNTENVIYLSGLFANCKSLESIDLSSFETSKVESINSMFLLCQSLKEVNLSSFTSNALSSATDLFCGCVNLLKVDLGAMDFTSIDNLYSAFWSGTAQSSRACAIRCISATQAAIDKANTSKRTSYYTWVQPGEEFPDISPDHDSSLYYSSDFSMDGKSILLNKATKGKGINIVLMGDAYSDRLINDGTYESDMREAMEIMFGIEPYKSFRDLFNVYMVYAVSENEVASGNTALGSKGMVGNSEIINAYALSAVLDRYLTDIAIVVIGHDYNCLYGSGSAGQTWLFFEAYNPDTYPTVDYGQTQQAISLIPKYPDSDSHDFAWTVNHEFGHCFAKLADEYIENDDNLTDSEKEFLYWHTRATGIYRNIDITNNAEEIKWKQFLTDTRYGDSGIGIFEGGYLFKTGVWRPSYKSLMNNGSNATNYFNAPSREAIYNRIHKLAYGDDWQFDYETFVEWDTPNRNIDVELNKSTSVQTKAINYDPPRPHLEMRTTVDNNGNIRHILIMD